MSSAQKARKVQALLKGGKKIKSLKSKKEKWLLSSGQTNDLQCPYVVYNANDGCTGNDSFKRLDSNGTFYALSEFFYFETSPDSVFQYDRKCLSGVMYSARFLDLMQCLSRA